MGPARQHPGKVSIADSFPTEWAMGAEQQEQQPEGARAQAEAPVASIREIGRTVRRPAARLSEELDGAA